MRLHNRSGFSLAEVVVVTGIMAFVTLGMLRLFISGSYLTAMSGNKTAAVNEAQNKIEEIRNTVYDNIVANFSSGGTPGNTFTLSEITGTGVVYIDNSNAELLEIEVVINWRDKMNRVIGEDLDLDGVLDAGEDLNGNTRLDSTVRLVTLITRR